MKTKFDLLFEEIMSDFSDKDIFGTDVHKSILKIYKLNNKGFEDLIQEITNFNFLEPNAERTEIIKDLTVESYDNDFNVCKIMVFEKETNKILFDVITYCGNNMNEIIDLISYVENPRRNIRNTIDTL